MEIIEYFDPVEWYIENPYFSAMRDLPCMKGLTSYRFDYCRFGFLYQKPTIIWTNRTDLEDHTCACASKQHRYTSESRPRINLPKAQRRMSRGQKIGIVFRKSSCDTSFGIAMRRRFNVMFGKSIRPSTHKCCMSCTMSSSRRLPA